MNKILLMSDCRHFNNQAKINPYYHDEAIDLDQATLEHQTIKNIFEKIGCTVITVPSPADSQDGVYTANWALVRDDRAILSRLPNVRRSEEAHAKRILEDLGKTVIEVPSDWRFSGQGDALACGDLLFCGRGYRSDESAQAFASEQLGFQRIQLQTVPQLDSSGSPIINPDSGWEDSFFYDIDLAMAIIRQPVGDQKGLIAYCEEAFTSESQQFLEQFDLVDKIKIDLDEAVQSFAGNLVSTGQDVVMSSHAPKLKRQLEELGLTVHTPEITELVKGGGYIRCISLALD